MLNLISDRLAERNFGDAKQFKSRKSGFLSKTRGGGGGKGGKSMASRKTLTGGGSITG